MQLAQRAGAHRRVRDLKAALVERAEEIAHHPVASELGVAALGHGLEIIGARLLIHEHAGIIGRELVLRDEARLLGVGQLRETCLDRLNPSGIELERQ